MLNTIVKKRRRILNKKLFWELTILAFIIIIVCKPAFVIESMLNALIIWASVLVPSLFPFIILSKLFAKTNIARQLSCVISPLTKKLYKTPGQSGYIFLMSVMSGYPIGAKLVSEQYQSGQISKAEALRISSFSSTSGPMFIIGTVGAGLFLNFKLGIVIFISHVFAALLNGLLYRKAYHKHEGVYSQSTATFNKDDDVIFSSIKSIAAVGAYVAIFFLICDILASLNMFYLPAFMLSKIGIPQELTMSVLSGMIEMTNGILGLTTLAQSDIIIGIISTMLISYGGISTIMQANEFLKKVDIPVRYIIKQKITHSVLSGLLALIFGLIIF